MFTTEQVKVLREAAEETKKGSHTFVTREEGMDLAQAGYIEVNASIKHPKNELSFGATITAQGQAYLQSLDAAHAPDPFPISDAAPMPPDQVSTNAPPTPMPPMPPMPPQQVQTQGEERKTEADTGFDFPVEGERPRPRKVTFQKGNPTAGRKSQYPYDALQVNQSFFVPDTACKSMDAHKTMKSSVAGQNKKFRVPKIVGYNSDGTPQFAPLLKDGQPVLDANGHQRYVMVNTKRFKSYKISEVSPSEPVLGARVFREPLKPSDKQAEKPVT